MPGGGREIDPHGTGPSGRPRRVNRKAAIHRALREKYLHSRAAALHEEGIYDKAIADLQAALAVEERHYTRYQLALAYAARNELQMALSEAGRAIDLAPSVAEYWYQRSVIRRQAGDEHGAEADQARAIGLDANYGRMERMRRALAILDQGTAVREILDWCAAVSDRHPRLRGMVHELVMPLRELDRALEGSCPVRSCPAYCCYFSDETVVHGVHVGAWKLHAIRVYLEDEGLDESVFLDRLAYSGEEHLTGLIPPHQLLKEGREHYVYFPKRRRAVLGRTRLKGLPLARDCRTLVWVTERARPCAFLRDRTCAVYDAGGEASLDACRQFLCLTGLVVVVAVHLGVVEVSRLEGRAIGELNRIATELLFILADEVFGNARLADLTARVRDALRELVRLDAQPHGAPASSVEQVAQLGQKWQTLRASLCRRASERAAAIFDAP